MTAMAEGAPARARRRTAQEQIDTRRLEIESENRAMISMHMDECRDRYVVQTGQLTRLTETIEALRAGRESAGKEIYWAIIKASGAIIVLLLGGMGTLAAMLLRVH